VGVWWGGERHQIRSNYQGRCSSQPLSSCTSAIEAFKMEAVGSVGCEHYKRKSKFVVSKFNYDKFWTNILGLKRRRLYSILFRATIIIGKVILRRSDWRESNMGKVFQPVYFVKTEISEYRNAVCIRRLWTSLFASKFNTKSSVYMENHFVQGSKKNEIVFRIVWMLRLLFWTIGLKPVNSH
jgi:hypothetical protein